MSAQRGYNMNMGRRRRIRLNNKGFKRYCNAFPMPRGGRHASLRGWSAFHSGCRFKSCLRHFLRRIFRWSKSEKGASPSGRYFYADPLAAAYMAKHFGIRILDLILDRGPDRRAVQQGKSFFRRPDSPRYPFAGNFCSASDVEGCGLVRDGRGPASRVNGRRRSRFVCLPPLGRPLPGPPRHRKQPRGTCTTRPARDIAAHALRCNRLDGRGGQRSPVAAGPPSARTRHIHQAPARASNVERAKAQAVSGFCSVPQPELAERGRNKAHGLAGVVVHPLSGLASQSTRLYMISPSSRSAAATAVLPPGSKFPVMPGPFDVLSGDASTFTEGHSELDSQIAAYEEPVAEFEAVSHGPRREGAASSANAMSP